MTRVRTHLITFTGLLILAFLLIALDQGRRIEAPQDIGQWLTIPAESGLSSVGHSIGSFVGTVQKLHQLEDENETLRRQVDELTLVNVRSFELEAENRQLREQLGFKEEHPNYVLQVAEIVAQDTPARVVGGEVSNLIQAVRINQGQEAGVEPGMSVITARGLVGQVKESGRGWAKVLLVTDETSRVTAIVQQGRAGGIVEGTGSGLVMRYIPHEQRVEPGDVVLSAGLGGLFPKGLVLGVIESVERSDINPWQEAVVRSTVEFPQLEYVFVIRSFRPLEEASGGVTP
ncbi:MAG: rod shape-determining protein MreC [Chloroflexota bacterium]|nr:rod shape-determining protein MreC [Chloroflexota bacterium]